MKFLVTKKQVEEMYSKVIDNYTKGITDYTLTIFKDNNNKIQWTFDNEFDGEKIYRLKDAKNDLFEWVILKEIGGRRKYTKKELIDGIQWNITANYQITH